VRTVLAGDPAKDKKLQAALNSIGYTEKVPVLRPGHPIWESADCDLTGTEPGVAFVPTDTHCPKSIMGNLVVPMCKEFHTALCE
jgi:hypothetical protein